jgi:predicted DNA-binding protein (MmcQ/YjbR family)
MDLDTWDPDSWDPDTWRNACLQQPGVTEDLPFDAHTLAFRVGGKIFALLALDEQPLRLNLKCDPARAIELREQYPGQILPGYHMNKRHWNTLVLDEALPAALVRALIAHSYQLVYQKLSPAQRDRLSSSRAQ